MTETQLDIDALKGSGTEIARYRLSSEERVVIGRRLYGGAEIVDVPASGRGETYRVDGGFQDARVLEAFIEDYLVQARLLDCCPMGTEAVGALVDQSEAESVDSFVAAVWGG